MPQLLRQITRVRKNSVDSTVLDSLSASNHSRTLCLLLWQSLGAASVSNSLICSASTFQNYVSGNLMEAERRRCVGKFQDKYINRKHLRFRHELKVCTQHTLASDAAEVNNYVHSETLIGAVALRFAWQSLEKWRHGENESDYFVCSFLQIIIIFRGPPLQLPEMMATTNPQTQHPLSQKCSYCICFSAPKFKRTDFGWCFWHRQAFAHTHTLHLHEL